MERSEGEKTYEEGRWLRHVQCIGVDNRYESTNYKLDQAKRGKTSTSMEMKESIDFFYSELKGNMRIC